MHISNPSLDLRLSSEQLIEEHKASLKNPTYRIGLSILGPQFPRSSKMLSNVIPLGEDCKQKIRELRNRNKEMMPHKFHQGRLTLVGIASLVALIGGALLALIGLGLTISGLGLPAGVPLLVLGIALIASRVPLMNFYHKKITFEKNVEKNISTINNLKKLYRETSFKDFVRATQQELGLTHLTLPELVSQQDFIHFYNLQLIHQKSLSESKADPRSRAYRDCSAYLNRTNEKIIIINNFLEKINNELEAIQEKLHKNKRLNQNQVLDLHSRKNSLLKLAFKLKKARQHSLKDAPVQKMSHYSFDELEILRKKTVKVFRYIDLQQ